MTPLELGAIIKEVHGSRGQRKMSADVQRGEVTMSRWQAGITPIGSTEALLIRLLLMLHRQGIDWRKWLASYLREEAGLPPDQPDSIEDLL